MDRGRTHRRRHHLAGLLGGVLALTSVTVLGSAGISPPASALDDTNPDFGPNVTIFDPSTPLGTINTKLQSLSGETEFSQNRHAVFFKPGTYGSAAGQDDPATATDIVNAQVGYYGSVAGLGASPEDVVINGALHAEPGRGGSLTNFWRSLSNMTINPIQRPVGADAEQENPQGVAPPHTMRWSVSQAAPLRRLNLTGDLDLNGRFGSNSFGSVIADSRVSGNVNAGQGLITEGAPAQAAQAQYYVRDSEIGSWTGETVNHVFSGVDGAPATTFDPGGITTLPTTPVSRPAPFLYLDDDKYAVFIPKASTATSGAHWGTSPADGTSIPMHDFYIAQPSASAATLNLMLSRGKNLLFTPGVYRLDQPLQVDRPGTVVMGLGYATLTPVAGTAAIEVGDVDGVVVSALTVDAGSQNSDVLVQVGTPGSDAGDAADPTSLHDVFFRIGGPGLGKATTSLEVNSDDVLLDHTWLWRGDHGTGVGWTVNTADHGLVVNGDDVTALGLFVEHYQKTQTIWNGDGGRMVFYQSEMPYDPPSQAAWSDGASPGYASYRVGPQVRTHDATGMAMYTLFTRARVYTESAVQAPVAPRVRFTAVNAAVLAIQGGINHVVNDYGAGVDAAAPTGTIIGMSSLSRVAAYPPADVTAPTFRQVVSSVPARNGWLARATLSFEAADDYSPAPTFEVSLDGGAWRRATSSYRVPQGRHIVRTRAVDSSGNPSTTLTWSGRIDSVRPTIAGRVTRQPRLAVSVRDTGSGVTQVAYRVNHGRWRTASVRAARSLPLPRTTRLVEVRATDVAGNTSRSLTLPAARR